MLVLAPVFMAITTPVFADTGEELCKDWGVLPEAVTTSSGTTHNFRIDTVSNCRDDFECVWSLTSAVGVLQADQGLNVDWDAPSEPPDACEPLDTSLVASCTLWGTLTSTDDADIQVRCTDQERDDLEQQLTEDYSVGGGGCTSAKQAEALLLFLPLGLFGLRRRMLG